MPGSSLKLWEEIYPEAKIFGADIDHKILFHTERISTFWVDQTSDESLQELGLELSNLSQFDLIVDDGLHNPVANLKTFLVLSDLVAPGGYYVIEDIESAWSGFWTLFGNSLKNFATTFEVVPAKTHSADGFFIAQRKI